MYVFFHFALAFILCHDIMHLDLLRGRNRHQNILERELFIMKKLYEKTALNINTPPRTGVYFSFLLLGVFLFILSAFAAQANTLALRGIGTKEDLIKFQQGIQNGTIPANTYAELTEDIDLGGTKWTPIHISGDLEQETPTGYTGIFNGNGHVISGFNPGSVETAEGPTSYTGFVAALGQGGVICNLVLSGNITNSKPISTLYVGAFAALNMGAIGNCTSLCSVSLPGTDTETSVKYAGGIAGLNEGNIQSCINNGRISMAQSPEDLCEGSIGGIAGVNMEGRIAMCVNTGDLLGHTSIGGIASDTIGGSIVSCVNTGSIKRQSEEFALYFGGGIAGNCDNSSAITNCLNSGSVTAIYAGGIVGSSNIRKGGPGAANSIMFCTNRGAVHGYYFEEDGAGKSLAGGIAAETINTTVKSCTNTGAVTAEKSETESETDSETMGSGGIAATILTGSKVSNCAFTGNAAYNYKSEETTYDDTSVKSFDATILDKSAVTTLSLMPSVRLQPKGKSAFTLLVNGKAVTPQDITAHGITAVKSGDVGGEEFASIGDFTDGIAPVEAQDKFGVGVQGYEFAFSPTDFKTSASASTSGSSAALSGNADKFTSELTPLFANMGSEAKLPDTPSYRTSSGGGGCSAGFAALALLAMIPLAIRKKK